MLRDGGQEPPAPVTTPDYPPGDRITAAVCSIILFAVGALLVDIVTNGRLLGRLTRSPAPEAEHNTREALQ